MSFWNLSDGQTAQQQTTFDMGGGDLAPIPKNTQLKVFIEEAKWDEHLGDRYISLKWEVIDGEFKGRKLFQKIRVNDHDSKKRDKAIRMLSAIDSNAGGGLMLAGVEPGDEHLAMHLMQKPMAVVVQVWKIKDEMTGEVKEGNWISAVAPLNAQAAKPQQQAQQQSPNVDDIGF